MELFLSTLHQKGRTSKMSQIKCWDCIHRIKEKNEVTPDYCAVKNKQTSELNIFDRMHCISFRPYHSPVSGIGPEDIIAT